MLRSKIDPRRLKMRGKYCPIFTLSHPSAASVETTVLKYFLAVPCMLLNNIPT